MVSQSGLTETDLAGLGAEEIGALMANQNKIDEFRRATVSSLINRADKRRAAQRARDVAAVERIREDQAAVRERQQELRDRQLERQQTLRDKRRERIFTVEKMKLQNRLDKSQTPQEQQQAVADYWKTLYEIDAKAAQAEKSRAQAEHVGDPKEPSPVTWTTATRTLMERMMGHLQGAWEITPELKDRHRLAQNILVSLKQKGLPPLQSVNVAERVSNKYYDLIEAIVKVSEQDERLKTDADRQGYVDEQIKEVNKNFERDVGFNPGR